MRRQRDVRHHGRNRSRRRSWSPARPRSRSTTGRSSAISWQRSTRSRTGGSSHFLRAHSSRFRAHLAARRGGRTERRPALQAGRRTVPRAGRSRSTSRSPTSSTPSGSQTKVEPTKPARCSPEAREIFERLRATPWLERVDAVRRETVSAHDLPELRHREPGRPEVLRRVRRTAGGRPARRAARERARAEVLRRVRGGAGCAEAQPRACGGLAAAGGAAARLRALRRPRRLHDGVGGPRRRGHARAAVPLLRHRAHG